MKWSVAAANGSPAGRGRPRAPRNPFERAMKLLVLAQTPPPLHGQSAMVQTLLDGLGASPGFEVHHVNLRLSADAADIGRWRPGKVAGILRACVSALWLRLSKG